MTSQTSKEFYFCLYLTENEHDAVHGYIQEFCDSNKKSRLMYYRKLKDGHVPMYREVKVAIHRDDLRGWYGLVKDERLGFEDYIVENPYKTEWRVSMECKSSYDS